MLIYLSTPGEQGTLLTYLRQYRTNDQSPSVYDVSYAPAGSVHRKNDAEARWPEPRAEMKKRKIVH